MHDPDNQFSSGTECRLKVPVDGPQGNGILHVFAQLTGVEAAAEMRLRRCELELKETSKLLPEEYGKKRLVVYDRERHGDIKRRVNLSTAPQQQQQ